MQKTLRNFVFERRTQTIFEVERESKKSLKINDSDEVTENVWQNGFLHL